MNPKKGTTAWYKQKTAELRKFLVDAQVINGNLKLCTIIKSPTFSDPTNSFKALIPHFDTIRLMGKMVGEDEFQRITQEGRDRYLLNQIRKP